jgi:SAM-dependent methyltransferase
MDRSPADPSRFDRLLAEASEAHFSGWDFSWLADRWIDSPLPWDYEARVRALLKGVESLLDLGTGGGEFLASLAPLPADIWATENYPPNVPIARARLEPLSVRLVTRVPDEALPFPGQHFDLVINRHESYVPAEVYRILKPGGTFVTQQVGGRDNLRLNELLQDQIYFEFEDWSLDHELPRLRAAGFDILEALEAFPEARVTDIGAVVYYLRAIPWQIEDFDVERYRERLLALHRQMECEGGLVLQSHRFFIQARRPEEAGRGQ